MRSLAAIALWLILLPGASSPAHAMEPAGVTEEKQPLRPNVPAEFDPASRGLGPAPLISEELGLAMHIPSRSIAVPQRVEGGLVMTVMDQAQPPAWSLSIQHIVALSPTVTAASQIQDHLEALRRAERPHRVISNDAVTIAGAEGRLCYIEHVTARGDDHVTGWLILPMGDDLFLVFSLIAMTEDFPALRDRLESAFATVNLRSADEVAERRLSALDVGRAFLVGITSQQLRDLVGLNQFSRIYRPDPSGDGETEIGFSHLEVFEGRRGEVNPERDESAYTLKEQEQGLIVRISGMVIGDLERNLFLDSLAIYWIGWDMEEETWKVVGTQRQGQAARTEVETGVRTAPTSGSPRPMLRAIRDNSATNLRDANEWALPDVYLSQALAPILGRLLPTDGFEPMEFAWYFYNFSQTKPEITRRLDRWAPAEDGSGNWMLSTRLSVDAAPIQSIYAADRKLVRTIRPDGVITEPTTPEALAAIWRRKGLPIERTPGRR